MGKNVKVTLHSPPNSHGNVLHMMTFDDRTTWRKVLESFKFPQDVINGNYEIVTKKKLLKAGMSDKIVKIMKFKCKTKVSVTLKPKVATSNQTGNPSTSSTSSSNLDAPCDIYDRPVASVLENPVHQQNAERIKSRALEKLQNWPAKDFAEMKGEWKRFKDMDPNIIRALRGTLFTMVECILQDGED